MAARRSIGSAVVEGPAGQKRWSFRVRGFRFVPNPSHMNASSTHTEQFCKKPVSPELLVVDALPYGYVTSMFYTMS